MTGIAALILQQNGSLSPFTVQQIITETATRTPITGAGGSPQRIAYSLHTWAGIEAAMIVNQSGSYSWTAQAYGEGGSIPSLKWYRRYDDSNTWRQVGTGSSYTGAYTNDGRSFTLKVEARSGTNGEFLHTDLASMYVYSSDCDPSVPC